MSAPQILPVIRPPEAPALAAGPQEAVWLSADGEIESLSLTEAANRIGEACPLVCHAPEMAARLGLARVAAHDLLELFAFVRPAKFVLPTANGLADALRLPRPSDRTDAALQLRLAAAMLLGELAALEPAARLEAAQIAATMAKGGWAWSASVLAALGEPAPRFGPYGGLDVWNKLGEWSEHAPPTPPDDVPVAAGE